MCTILIIDLSFSLHTTASLPARRIVLNLLPPPHGHFHEDLFLVERGYLISRVEGTFRPSASSSAAARK